MQLPIHTLSTFTSILCFLLVLVEFAQGLGFVQARRVTVERGEAVG